jgi:uncharacterized protein involved in exopolysaccharide biosynthesis
MIKDDFNVWENKNMNVDSNAGQTTKLRTNSIDIDFRRVMSIWPFILLFGLLGYVGGMLYLRYTDVVYIVTTSISIEEDREVTIGQALFGNERDPFNDKIAFFKSPTIASYVVDTLGLQYNAHAQGRFKNKDFYKAIKWYIIKDKPGGDVPEINFSIVPRKDGFSLKEDDKEEKEQWGVPFKVKGQTVVVLKLQDIKSEAPIYCYSRRTLASAFALSKNMNITTSKESNIITISYPDVSSDRAIDILNTLIRLNIDIMEADKSRTYSQAIRFIEDRLTPLAKELDSIENSLAHFKSTRGISDMSAMSQVYLQNIADYDKQLTEISIQKGTIAQLELFIQNPSLKQTDLSFVGVNNPTLQALLQQYIILLQQREKLALTATENNPSLKLVDQNIADLRSNMNKQIAIYKDNLAVAEAAYRRM